MPTTRPRCQLPRHSPKFSPTQWPCHSHPPLLALISSCCLFALESLASAAPGPPQHKTMQLYPSKPVSSDALSLALTPTLPPGATLIHQSDPALLHSRHAASHHSLALMPCCTALASQQRLRATSHHPSSLNRSRRLSPHPSFSLPLAQHAKPFEEPMHPCTQL